MSKRKAAKHRTAKPINQLPDIHITPTLEIDRPLIETLPEELIKLFAQESSEKKNPSSKYSIVTAVYNVELYLTAFFESITKQSIDFESSIEIILVDDGSIDKSSQIIQTWASRYPRNIRYLWQENAGQAKARNVGLRYAKHDWVTFIDPDDFVALDYFEKVDDSIRAANLDKKPIKMVSANLCFYLEDRNEFSDAHPLRYRFAKGNCIFPASNPNKHIQLSASTAFFKRIRILEKNLTFNEEIKPAFEDGHFVNRYLLDLEDAPIAFLSSAIYYYRKRENGSSTLDTAWEKPGRFNVQLRLGYLDLIKQSLNRYGYVKEFIQRVILYDLSWHFKRFINNESLLSHLTASEKKIYTETLAEIMSHISEDLILNFELAGMWFYHKVGLLSFYKNYDPKFAIVYIEEVDHIKDLVKLRYFTSMPDASEQFSWDNVPSTPLFSKTRTHTLYDQNFVYERTIWLRIGDVNRLNVIISKKPDTRLSLRGKQHRQGVNACDIRASFQKTGIDERNLPQEVIDIRQAAKTAEVVRKYSGCWILMDRNTQADDNAEHLYRYIVKSHPYTKVFFVLSETSQDWKRLSNDKFNLIAFGSLEHKLALLNAAHLISSHADQYIFGGLENKYYSDIKSFRYTFLQHGITKDDLSSWLNAKPIDCFVTATHPEYISIAENGPYKFTNKEVVLSGFARHDHLRALKNEADKIILIMPTWRNSLVGPTTGAGNERELNPDFAKTQYAESWRTILHSQELRILAEAHDYKIIFFPHANIQPYLHVFDVPSYISIQGHTAGESIQLQFSRANLVVTDYSSIAFEVAALDRAIVYFQFDAQEVFSGAHIYRPGYFNYHRDGFGPVCETASEVINSIEEILNNNGQPAENYLKRMHDTFAFKDEDNSKRIYEAIHRLEQSTISKQTCRPAIVEHARRLMKHAQWKEALLAWNQAEPEGTEYFAEASFSCALAYRKLGRSAEAAKSLQIADSVGYDYAKIQSEQLLNAIEEKDFVRINQLYTTINAEDLHNEIDDGLLAAIVKSQRLENNYTLALKLIERASDLSHPEILRERAEIASHLMLWPEALELWQIAVVENDDAAILRYAQSCREMKLYPEAASSIARIKNGDSLPGFYKEAAEIAFVNTQWKTAEKLWTHESEISSLTPDCWLKLAKSRRKSGDLTSANTAISKANTAKDKRTLLQEKALLLTALGEFHEAVGAWEEFISRKDLSPNRDAWLHLAGARYKTGQILQAKKELEKFESLCEATKKSLRLRELIEKSLTIKIAG